jgi:hypothetical protein
VHPYSSSHFPFDPDVTSKKLDGCAYGHALPADVRLNNVKMPATMGALALVPPMAYQVPL